MSTTTRSPADRGNWFRWLTPAIGLMAGVGFLIAAWIGGHPALGLSCFGIMAGAVLIFELVARRSELTRGLLDRRDERIAGIDLQATAFTGIVMILAVLVGVLVSLARDRDPMPYAAVGAAGGVAYLLAVIVLARRS
jgi:hypothetical protein